VGTSTPFGGPKNSNPLLPSFLNQPDGTSAANSQPDEQQPANAAPPQTTPPANDKRFQGARRSFNAYVRSGARDERARGRALRSFVRRAGGGATRTSQRMAVERRATANLAQVLNRAGEAAGGIREVVQTLDLAALADAPIETVYASLVDVICPPNGDLDDAHAREAYLEAVTEVMDRGYADIERPSAETVTEIIGTYITNVIHIRVVNAIANGLVTLPDDVEEVTAVEAGMRDFIGGCVDDALRELGGPLPVNELQATIDDLYSRAIEIVDYRADAEAEGEEE
jgi:hypothetical protein